MPLSNVGAGKCVCMKAATQENGPSWYVGEADTCSRADSYIPTLFNLCLLQSMEDAAAFTVLLCFSGASYMSGMALCAAPTLAYAPQS